MTKRFTFKEPNIGGFTPQAPFGVYATGHPINTTMRLFVGSINAYDRYYGRLEKLTFDESIQSKSSRSAKPALLVKKLFPDGDVTVEEYGKFLTRHSSANLSFFSELNLEICAGLLAKKHGRELESFLHLYRIMEYLGIALPTVYALVHNNFSQAHDFHKSLFKSDRDTDLTALRNFSSLLAKTDQPFTGLTFDIDYRSIDVDFSDGCVDELNSAFVAENSKFEFSSNVMELRFEHMCDFIVSLRNRLFHYRMNEKNVNIGNAGGIGNLLMPVVGPSYYWLYLLISEVIRLIALRELR